MLLKEGEYRFMSKRGLFFEPKGDFVLEMREHGKKLAKQLKGEK